MWFTRISIGNPVLATMMMVAFVVLLVAVPGMATYLPSVLF